MKTTEKLIRIEGNMEVCRAQLSLIANELAEWRAGKASAKMELNSQYYERLFDIVARHLEYWKRKHLSTLLEYPAVKEMHDKINGMATEMAANPKSARDTFWDIASLAQRWDEKNMVP